MKREKKEKRKINHKQNNIFNTHITHTLHYVTVHAAEMSLIDTQLFPRSMFDMENWLNESTKGESTLDMFDAFDELDTIMGRNLQW